MDNILLFTEEMKKPKNLLLFGAGGLSGVSAISAIAVAVKKGENQQVETIKPPPAYSKA